MEVCFFLFILGQILNAIALSFAAQSMLATLGAFSLVSNTLFAPCLLHEELSWLHVLSMFLIIAGASIVVLNSSHSEHNFTATELEKLYYRPSFIVLISFIVAAVFWFCCTDGILESLNMGNLCQVLYMLF